jgi:hypothetical protein
MVTNAVVLMIKFAEAAAPATVPVVMGVAFPTPRVRVPPAAMLAGPTVINPVEAPPIVAPTAATLTAAAPKFNTPTPAAETAPERLTVDGEVAITPAVNTQPEARVRVPVLPKVVATAPEMVPPPPIVMLSG